MKKQTTDAGLDYLIKLGIRAAKDRNSIKRELENTFGKKETDAFFKEFNELCKNGDPKSYDLKNSIYARSIFFTGSFDADIIRKCCNWVKEIKDSFGQNILDVGCDCGFMTCFIALMLPEAKITSIDRSEQGVAVAERLAGKLGITNITFKATELADLEENDFDTVFSMRTMTENSECIEDPENYFIKQKNSFKEALNEYGKLLASKVKDGGNLITIENTGCDTLLAGWLEVLYEAGFSGDTDLYKEIICKEVGENVEYQALVLNKLKSSETGMDCFMNIWNLNHSFGSGEYRNWDAKLIYDTKKDKLLDGFTVTGEGATLGSGFSVWTVKDNSDLILFCQYYEVNLIVQVYPIDKKSLVDKAMKDALENVKKYPTLKIENLID